MKKLIVLFLALVLVSCGREEAKPAPAPNKAPVAAAAKPVAPEPPPIQVSERALKLHRDAFVMDAHCDALLKVVNENVDLAKRSDEGHVDFPRMKEGGLDAEVFAVWIEPDFIPDKARQRALDMIDAMDALVTKNPDTVGLALTAADAERITAFIGIEGGEAIQDDPASIEMFFKKGVRYMTLTWWNNTHWADASGDKPKWNGLTDLGKKVVAEMNRVGMVVDVSHVAEKTFWDALAVTTRPVIASHSDTKALYDHHRNLSDDQLRALAKNGGVVGINFTASFLDGDFDRKSEEMRKKIEPQINAINAKWKGNERQARIERWALYKRHEAELPGVPVDRLIDHIDHAVKIAGVDHVGLGSDFDGFVVGPREITDCTKLPIITQKLIDRGYSDEDVKKILGGNFLRVFREVIGR